MTTIICVKRDNHVAIGGDGQATLGNTVMKQSVTKIKRLYNNQIVTGMAGSTADAFNLYERFESKLQKYQGIITRAAIELARDWRTDKILRQLEAMMIVANKEHILLISGNGDVIEPDQPILAIGSGGNYALSAAKALYSHSKLSAKEIVTESLKIAGEICIYTNQNHTIETL